MWNNRAGRRTTGMVEIMSVAPTKDSAEVAARETAEASNCRKVKCLCGKWWSLRSGNTLILRCKLCRREIVIEAENMKITYR